MFGAFQTFGKLGAIGKAISAAWSPLALWPTGTEPGMWIDPSNLATSWQDSTGTTPVVTPGTVEDWSNPVGLALDLRLGATALTDPGNHLLQATSTARPLLSGRVNLLSYTEDFTAGAWGVLTYGSGTSVITPNYEQAPDGTTTACRLVASAPGGSDGGTLRDYRTFNDTATRSVYVKSNTGLTQTITICAGLGAAGLHTIPASGWVRIDSVSQLYSYFFNIGLHRSESTDSSCDISIWHPQLELGTTATPYQAILTNESVYPSTGFPIYQKYDGTDDGMATASFAAGTLSNNMDCLIAVRRDSGAQCVAGLYSMPVRSIYFGHAQAGSSGACAVNVGTPTVWVDGVQLTGGTSVEPGTLNTALTVGEWHIMEFRGLDLSAITQAGWGDFGSGFSVNGARGDILLYPSTASTEDKDAARQYLADKYGVTLP